jgi:parallel beta-helix repeat protein
MRMSHLKTILVAVLAGLTLGGAADTQLPFSGAASSAAACTRLASSSGSDTAAGTPGAPYRTAAKLLASLQPGDVGCLAAGQTFSSASTEDQLNTSNVTLTSSPGGSPAVLLGLLYIGGSNVTVTGLSLNGHNTFTEANNPASVEGQAGVFVVGNNVSVTGNDIYNGHTAICMEIGLRTDTGFIKPSGAVISNNRIHACGVLPQTREEHGIYLLHGSGTTISNNLFYDIADFGIQLYPDSTNTLVDSNVVASTGTVGGIVVSSEAAPASSGNTIRNNIVTHTNGYAFSTYWGGPSGSNNLVTNNCVADVRSQDPMVGMTITGTKVVADAGLDSNYMLHAGSACTGFGPSWIQPGASGAPPASPPAAPPVTKPPSGGGGVTTPPRGGQATPPAGGGVTTTSTSHAGAIAITSPLSGGTPAVKKPGARVRTFSFILRWKGKASKTYELRLDKHRWISVKGPKHTFKHLRAGKHKVTVRLKGTRGHATTRIITVG